MIRKGFLAYMVANNHTERWQLLTSISLTGEASPVSSSQREDLTLAET